MKADLFLFCEIRQHEAFQLDFSGPSEYGQANSSNADATSSRHGRLRLIKDADDRLPDAVRQAKERLLNRLQSVDLTGTRLVATLA